MSILFSIIVFLVASQAGYGAIECFRAKYGVHSTLKNPSNVKAFWNTYYRDAGGIAAILGRERSDWTKVNPCSLYALLIFHELKYIDHVRMNSGILVFSGVAAFAAPCFGYHAVVFAFVAGLCVAVVIATVNRFYAHHEAVLSVFNLFRTVRLWMEADRDSLEAWKDRPLVANIIAVIDDVEPVNEFPLIGEVPQINEKMSAARALAMAGYNPPTLTCQQLLGISVPEFSSDLKAGIAVVTFEDALKAQGRRL
jgi:hypothetical protein